LNAALYAAQGQWGYAGVSLAGMVPYIGDAGKAAKYANKLKHLDRVPVYLTAKITLMLLRENMTDCKGRGS